MSRFHGLLTAIVTPFRDGALDESTHRALVRRQIAGGVDGLVPCGTTGETPTLSPDEQRQVIQWTLDEAKGRPVLAGIGTNSTTTSVNNARAAEGLGVQGVLATTPYYNKPTQQGLYEHFRAIAKSTALEVCLYDVPGRTGVQLAPETVARLAELDNITAIKDATADLAHATRIRRLCGDGFVLLSGDDFTTLPFLLQGGDGVISVASNVSPEAMATLVHSAIAGDLPTARAAQLRLFPLFDALFAESNPIPAKAAMASLGLLQESLRLPMCPMGDALRPHLDAVLAELELR